MKFNMTNNFLLWTVKKYIEKFLCIKMKMFFRWCWKYTFGSKFESVPGFLCLSFIYYVQGQIKNAYVQHIISKLNQIFRKLDLFKFLLEKLLWWGVVTLFRLLTFKLRALPNVIVLGEQKCGTVTAKLNRLKALWRCI